MYYVNEIIEVYEEDDDDCSNNNINSHNNNNINSFTCAKAQQLSLQTLLG